MYIYISIYIYIYIYIQIWTLIIFNYRNYSPLYTMSIKLLLLLLYSDCSTYSTIFTDLFGSLLKRDGISFLASERSNLHISTSTSRRSASVRGSLRMTFPLIMLVWAALPTRPLLLYTFCCFFFIDNLYTINIDSECPMCLLRSGLMWVSKFPTYNAHRQLAPTSIAWPS